MTRKRVTAGLTATLIAGGLIGSAPPANAGCINGGFSAKSRCDGPVQTDGRWQRCVDYDAHTATETVRTNTGPNIAASRWVLVRIPPSESSSTPTRTISTTEPGIVG
jgi:hypothetical protein